MRNYVDFVRFASLGIAALLASNLWLASVRADDRATDMANGFSELVIGTGFVIGLPGTGDSQIDEGLVEKSIIGVLRRAGLDPWQGEIVPGRVAKVVVTAELPPAAEDGALLGITLTAVGDATSLAGGTLLPVPLRDPSGKLYAVGQGSVAVDSRVATAAARIERSRDGALKMVLVLGNP